MRSEFRFGLDGEIIDTTNVFTDCPDDPPASLEETAQREAAYTLLAKGERLCWFCEHYSYQSGSEGWSEETPGWGISISCGKNHWDFDPDVTSESEFRCMLSRAQNCPDFVLASKLRSKP